MRRSRKSWDVMWLALAACGCGSGEAGGEAPSAPALVEATGEEALGQVQLSSQEVQRLGIALAPAAIVPVSRSRLYAGEVLVPPGAVARVNAPFAGTLRLAAGASSLSAGAEVQSGQALLELVPLLTPERGALTPSERVRLAEAQRSLASDRLRADGEVARARVSVEAMKKAAVRAEQLLASEAGSMRAREEAAAELARAEASLETAESLRAMLSKAGLDAGAGTVEPLALGAPLGGILWEVQAVPGQVVAAGDRLFAVLSTRELWVRAAVRAEDHAGLDTDAAAAVVGLTAAPGERGRRAVPVAAPPTASTEAATVDLYYRIADVGGPALRPAQRVGVRVPMKGAKESLAVPWSAVVHDILGGTWVYLAPLLRDIHGGPPSYDPSPSGAYRRRRIEVAFVTGVDPPLAAVTRGLEPGEQVVIAGAMELYGAEFPVSGH